MYHTNSVTQRQQEDATLQHLPTTAPVVRRQLQRESPTYFKFGEQTLQQQMAYTRRPYVLLAIEDTTSKRHGPFHPSYEHECATALTA